MVSATAATAFRTSQVNARIEASLKHAGDAALANAGFTPTQAVRAVWQLAADNADSPEVIIKALDPDRGEADPAAWDQERIRRAEWARRGPAILGAEVARLRGLAYSDQMDWGEPGGIDSLPYDELMELAYEESHPELLS